MPTLRAGIVQATAGEAGPYVPDPDFIETDWTITSLPGAWTTSSSFTYSGTGTYGNDTGGTIDGLEQSLSRDYGLVTMLGHHVIVDDSNQSTGLYTASTGNGAGIYHVIESGVARVDVFSGNSDLQWSSLDEADAALDAVLLSPGDLYIGVALSIDNDVWWWIGKDDYFHAFAATPTNPMIVADGLTVAVEQTPYNDVAMAGGTPGDVRVVDTYFGIDEYFTTSNVINKFIEWGYVAPLDPLTIETDWTIESLPTGWSVGPSGDAVYAADGTYTTGASEFYFTGYPTTPTMEGFAESVSLVFGLNIDSLAPSQIARLYMSGGDFFATLRINIGQVFGPTNELVIAANGLNAATVPAPATGRVVIAFTYGPDGTFTWYHIDSSATTTDSELGDPVLWYVTEFDTSFQIFPEQSGASPGTPGDLKIIGTYIGYNEVLTQLEIEAMATSWGV